MNPINLADTDREQSRFFAHKLFSILGEVFSTEQGNCLKVIYKSTIFFIHFNQGQLVYATNSVAPFERLERHLRRLSNQNSQITNSIIQQPRQQFKNDLQTYTSSPTDYESIMWLLEVGHLTVEEAIALIRRITREVFESLLCLPDLSKYQIIPQSQPLKELCRFDASEYIEQCQKRLTAWHVFADQIWSSYQRPYLVTVKDKAIAGLSKQQHETICKLLTGLNFRQISAVIDRDELVVAKILYPSMLDKEIVLRDPKPPFDLLPNLPQQKNAFELPADADWRGEDSKAHKVNSHSKQTVITLAETWKVAYVDHDISAQNSLSECLEQNLFQILAIADPMNAFAEIIEFKPSLIFLRVNMPELNGYELCSLLRNHQEFRLIPIIMVGEASQSINEAQSKRIGATDNIAKPFDRTKLLTKIWQYLQ
jgi:two-component system, chemotaxis family, response regulator PixG